MATKSETSDSSMGPVTPSEIPVFTYAGVMPRPGQSGSLSVFTGQNASDYLDEFNVECELYRVKPEQRVLLFPHYCIPTIKDVVKLLPGYEYPRDWDHLQNEIKKLYWAGDHPKNTIAALNALIRSSHSIPLSVFVLKFSSITDVLVSKSALSDIDRFAKLLEGLDEKMRNKVIKLCTQKGWRVTDQDTGEKPNFDDIKKYLEAEAKTAERVAVYEKENAIRGPSNLKPVVKTSISPATTAVPSPALDPVRELTEQLAALTLMVKSLSSNDKPAVYSAPAPSISVPPSGSFPRGPRRCIWCDSTEHMRKECSSFDTAFKSGGVAFNNQGRVILAASGQELVPAYGRGGMKAFYESQLQQAPIPIRVNVNAISFDDGFGSTAGTRTVAVKSEEWVDVDVEEKRKRDGMDFIRNTRPRKQAPAVTTGTVPDSGPASQTQPSGSPSAPSATMDVDPEPTKPKYKLQSELGKAISSTDIGEKIMNAPIMLTIKEFLAVSPEMANYIHDQTRRRRAPIDSGSPVSSDVTTANAQATSLIDFGKAYYALPSGRASVVLDDQLKIPGLLDGGSELNIMSEEYFRKMDYPIDGNIQWRINGFDSKIEQELDERYNLDGHGRVLGVLHDVPVNVGGVTVKQHLFVISHLPAGLILGRPWERSTRATYSNEDDGTLTVTIRSPDNLKEVQFVAAHADHERNRDTVRPKE
jgi:hypothetical protein